MNPMLRPMPVLASEQGADLDFFMSVLHIAIAVGFTVWFAWFVTALVRFRAGKHPKADHAGLRSRAPFVLVGLMAVTEFALLLGLSMPYWENFVVAAPETAEDPFVVRVVAQQFQWNVHYPGPDGVFGRTAISLMNPQTNLLGLDSDDPYSEDDITTLNQLHLPVDRTVVVHLSTKDMIHSFFLPEFRVKHDAVPGMRIPVRFKPVMTTAEFRAVTGDETRNFEIACAQLCGISHYTMRGFVTVETQQEWDAWYAAQLEQKALYADDDWDDF